MTRRIPTQLAEARALIESIEIPATSSVDALDDVLHGARDIETSIAGLIAKLSHLSQQLDGSGKADAETLLLGRGQASTSKVRSEIKQGRALFLIPELSERPVEAEKLEAITNQLGKLDENQLENLDLRKIAKAASELPTDTFKSTLRRKVESVIKSKRLTDHAKLRANSELTHWFDRKQNMGFVRAALDPERYEKVANAIDSKTTALSNEAEGRMQRNSNLAAAALVDLVTSSQGLPRTKPQITVIVDSDSLSKGELSAQSTCETEAGSELPFEAVQRLSCDAILNAVKIDGNGLPLSVGRKSRTATDAQWAAAKSLYDSCGWHGCDSRIQWCQLHHIREWSNGGNTDFENLVPLCSKHHHKVHEGKWSIRLKPDRSLEHYKPDGVLWVTGDPPTRVKHSDCFDQSDDKNRMDDLRRLHLEVPDYGRGQLGIAV